MDIKPIVYFAGPDVFRPNPEHWFEYVASWCKRFNIEPLFPIEEVYYNVEGETIEPSSFDIYEYNLGKIEACDYVLANLEPFRGVSCDPGTALEIGYAIAKKKKVYGYYNGYIETEYINRVKTYRQMMSGINYPNWLNSSLYPVVEDFKLPENLMIYHACEGVFDDILMALSRVAVEYKVG